MTETQSTPDHRAPLAPGEMRKHQVGTRLFRVMHIAGGSFTQASVVEANTPTRVLATEMFEQDAVRAYADAIEQAESDAIDALEGDDTPEPLTAEGAGFTPNPDGPNRPDFNDDFNEVIAEQESAPAPTLADDVAALRAEIDACGRGHRIEAMLARLDRIAARAPQRATDANGTVYRMHMPCRRVMIESRSACRYCDEVGAWRALYVLPDGA